MRKAQVLLVWTVMVGMVSCRTHPPVKVADTAAGVPSVLSHQNADAAIYQHSSAEVYRLYEQCYEMARLRLDANLSRPHTLPAAVIVDIDETVLDNSPYQVKNAALGRTYSPATWNEWALMCSAKALPGALEFLGYAAEKGCEVFYITNRSASEKNATIKNLFELRFPNADDMHVLCMDGDESDKTKRRARVSEGHYVALLVGDQLRDFDEGFKDRTTDYGRNHVITMHDTLRDWFILLPNPMYGTWLDAVSGKDEELKLGKKAAFFKSNAY